MKIDSNPKHLGIISFCDLCEVWQMRCGSCEMGGCSGGHLQDCVVQDNADLLEQALDLLMQKTNLADLLQKQ